MKNKEIEELLSDIDIIVHNNLYYMLTADKGKLLLSYIEQLENNRDKAIELLYKRKHVENLFGGVENSNTDKIIDILKGDSE